MKTIAFIDPFGQTPVNSCFNTIVLKCGLPCTYHMPAKFGFDSLESLKHADAYVILGSVTHVSENQDWQKKLIEFIIPKIESNIPTLGICYGHQLIAQHYGCEVGYIQNDQRCYSEVREVKFIKNSLGQISGNSLSLAYEHAQMVLSISDKFEHFASSSRSKFDGLKLIDKPYWGVQAHPEASSKFIKSSAGINCDQTLKTTLSDGYKIIQGFINEL